MTTAVNSNPSPSPRILLIGAGRFGREHLKEWSVLVDEGEARLAGIVVSRPGSAAVLASTYTVPVHVGLNDNLLASVDGVDIVTPSTTHAAIVRQCLPWTAVLCEKPLALNAAEAKELAALAAS